MMHLISYGSSEAYIEEEHAGKRHTITAILPREEVEEMYRRLTMTHKNVVGGEPCPTCGFQIVIRTAPAFQLEDEPDEPGDFNDGDNP